MDSHRLGHGLQSLVTDCEYREIFCNDLRRCCARSDYSLHCVTCRSDTKLDVVKHWQISGKARTRRVKYGLIASHDCDRAGYLEVDLAQPSRGLAAAPVGRYLCACRLGGRGQRVNPKSRGIDRGTGHSSKNVIGHVQRLDTDQAGDHRAEDACLIRIRALGSGCIERSGTYLNPSGRKVVGPRQHQSISAITQ